MLGVKRLGALGSLVLIGLLPAGAAYATTATPTPSPSHSASGAASQQDTQYLTTIHQVNLAVIQAGNLAQQHGASPQVQELGGQFVTDHAQLDQQVQSVASAAGVTLPDAPTADQQAALDKLQNASGADFDKMWIEDQFVVQNQALQATQTEIAQGTDPAVKQLAEAAAPVLQAHLNALVSAAQALGIPVPGGITVSPGPQGSSGAPTTGGTAPVTPTPTVS